MRKEDIWCGRRDGFLRRMVVKEIETLHLVQGLIFLLKFALKDY